MRSLFDLHPHIRTCITSARVRSSRPWQSMKEPPLLRRPEDRAGAGRCAGKQPNKQTKPSRQAGKSNKINEVYVPSSAFRPSVRPSQAPYFFTESKNLVVTHSSSPIRRRLVATPSPRLSIRRPSASGYGCGATPPSDSCYGAYAHAVPHGDNASYAACARPSHRRNTHSGYPRG